LQVVNGIQRFAGRTAIVTGAASGIGRATALRLAAEGAAVGCLDIDSAGLADTTAAIEQLDGGGAAVGFVCDVTDGEMVAEVFQAVETTAGMPEVVCSVAGVGGFSHTHETTEAEWARQIGVNLTGTFLVCRAALARWMRALVEEPSRDRRHRRAHPSEVVSRPAIVNVASSAGLIGQPYSAAYSASKGGVVQLTKALAVEYLEVGFRVNAVAPGGVDSPLIGAFTLPEDASAPLLNRITSPLGLADPSDIAAVIAFVASEEAGSMTGAIIAADGGLTA
jgi:NAD(P)-dependent dehydrogenase (short-subunit alcohol dehydrogenase family)